MRNLFIYRPVAPEMEQRKNLKLKRTFVHAMPRAIPCTSSYDPERVASEPLLS